MKVLVNDAIAPQGVQKLKDAGFEVVVDHLEPEDLKAQIKDYDALIVRSATKVRREIIEAAENLKVIGRAGVGLDNVDREAAKERGIAVYNTPAATSISVAELALGMMLSAARHIAQGTVSLKQGRWDKKKFKGIELYGKTLGIIGMGRIGSELAKRARAMGMSVFFFDAVVSESEFGTYKEMDEVLAEADFLSLHLPHNDSTHYLISTDAFAKMKDGAILVNAARGGVVDEEALYEALTSGKLRAAAVDVYESEPVTEHKLFSLDNVVLTPHVGAQAAEGQQRAGVQVAEKVIEALKGS
ncbi:3-phosphoglycerate dehydrogenase [candidate division TA06 bacterium B3_TA06]|uniref:3-phosphoglycerate dehydrogenase n=1 Tax=candidate division TA06 bacterium B3_TA06 TaxID=2012487 RepID=A0A532V902_UNCT6|nr:MAG: 3-phosphoglycerate dehydrogenase [candidate division TA06 bacterium B3_TA06]